MDKQKRKIFRDTFFTAMPVLIGIQNLVLALIKFSKINSCILKIFAAKEFIVGSDVFLSVIV